MQNFKYQRVVIIFWAFFWVCVLDTINNSRVEGKQIIPEKYRNLKHKGTIKTIVCPEDDDVIDCVDFYQQPAFDDPKIKNLKLPYDPFSDETEMTDDEPYLYQNWRKYGECPNGTIPIRRSLDHGKYHKNSYEDNCQFAVSELEKDDCYGAKARLSVWNPKVANFMEHSSSQILLTTEDYKESIQAGWLVAPGLYALSNKTRLFIHWTSDNWEYKGCYDHNCVGFVQTNKDIVLGGVLSPISTYNGDQYYIRLEMYKTSRYMGDWVLTYSGKRVGYWPKYLFADLSLTANKIRFGGEVMGMHTLTEMGSGHFAHETYNKAAYVSHIAVKDFDLNWEFPTTALKRKESSPTCYSVIRMVPNKDFGTHLFFGGPGRFAKDCT